MPTKAVLAMKIQELNASSAFRLMAEPSGIKPIFIELNEKFVSRHV